jgi:hypothetical protein
MPIFNKGEQYVLLVISSYFKSLIFMLQFTVFHSLIHVICVGKCCECEQNDLSISTDLYILNPLNVKK